MRQDERPLIPKVAAQLQRLDTFVFHIEAAAAAPTADSSRPSLTQLPLVQHRGPDDVRQLILEHAQFAVRPSAISNNPIQHWKLAGLPLVERVEPQ